MADVNPQTRRVESARDVVGWPPPGVSQADAAFLECLWFDLRASGATSSTEIQTQVENALRARPEVQGDHLSYKQGLQRLAGRHRSLAGKVKRYVEHDDFSSDHSQGEQHFLWVLPGPSWITWRIYLSPTPGTAADLVLSLFQRLSNVAGVGMKLSTHDALCRLRDGVVLYAEDDAAKDLALNAITQERQANSGRFSGTLVRFTQPLAAGVAGLGPEPYTLVTKLSKEHESTWSNNNKEWLDTRKLAQRLDRWQEPYIPSYTQFVASVLTTCYLLGEPGQQRVVRRRGGEPSQVGGAAFFANVYKAFTEMGFKPSEAAFGPPTVSGVGWLRFWLFEYRPDLFKDAVAGGDEEDQDE